MQTLKKFFPLSFKFVKDGGSLAIGIIIYAAVGLIVPAILTVISVVLSWLFSWTIVLPFIIGPIIGLMNTAIGLYCLAGIVFQILVFTKVFKDPDAPVEVDAVEEKTTDAE